MHELKEIKETGGKLVDWKILRNRNEVISYLFDNDLRIYAKFKSGDRKQITGVGGIHTQLSNLDSMSMNWGDTNPDRCLPLVKRNTSEHAGYIRLSVDYEYETPEDIHVPNVTDFYSAKKG